MAAIEVTFIVLSSIFLLYLLNAIFMKKRLPLVTELFYLCVYLVSLIFFFFPQTWSWLDLHFGVQLLLDLILVIVIFLLFAACVRLYQKIDVMRQEITNLTRIIALSDSKSSKKK